MNTKEQILSTNISKTQKILKLAALGYSMKDIAGLIDSGYGFVWAVLNKRYPTSTATYIPGALNRRFGIEIEAFGVPTETLLNALISEGIQVTKATRSTVARTWKLTTDGSVHGNNAFELVSPILEGEDGLAEVEKVSRVLKRIGARINKSCGLHVHIEATSFTLQQWKNTFLNYIRLEPIIDSFMPTSRRASNNTYCSSMIQTDIEDRISRSNSIEALHRVYCSRYYKVNVQSFSKFGTIEFRQHSGTIEHDKISNWVRFLQNLVEYSKTNAVSTSEFTELSKINQSEVVSFYAERIEELN